MSEAPAKKCPKGSPAWVMTFADLMSLLMCFFVLLLSFSEMDVQKYKQVAGSMKMAFGVQRTVKVKDPPKGTSIIAREFSPGKPKSTIIKVLQQQTTDDTKDNLDFSEADLKEKQKSEQSEQAKMIVEALKQEIKKGLLEVEVKDGKTIIRIQEKASFGSGSTDINDAFGPIIQKVSDTLRGTSGRIIVSGHTDNIPIHTVRFRSNWELSSGRAVSMVEKLLGFNTFDESRFLIEGHADSAPLETNDTPEGRAKNRRVEIAILEHELSAGNE